MRTIRDRAVGWLCTAAVAAAIFAYLVSQDLLRLGMPGGRIFLTRTDLLMLIAAFSLALALSLRWRVVTALLVLIGVQMFVAASFHAYFGGDLEPFHVTLLFLETADVMDAGLPAFGDHPDVIVSSVVPLLAVAWLVAKTRRRRATLWGSSFVAVAILAIAPVRVAWRADSHVFSPDPAKPFVVNTVQSFSYAALSAVGLIETPEVEFAPYRVISGTAPAPRPTIVLVIGEGISPSRMHIFGALRKTTPRLESWARGERPGVLLAARGFAAAVASHATMPLLLNIQREPMNERVSYSKTTNLFRLARERGYRTAYFSAQKVNLIAGSGKEFVQEIKTVDENRAYFATRGDMGVADWLESAGFPSGEGRLIVLHQRNIHGPYEKNYAHAPEFVRWPIDGVARQDYLLNSYDNGMLFYDAFLDRVVKLAFDRFGRDGPVYVFATSDHGQAFGAGDDRWGHSFLLPEVADVPFLLFTNRPGGLIAKAFAALAVPTHYELGRLIASAMGYKIENPNEGDGRILVNGPLKFGRGGYMQIETAHWPGAATVEVYDPKEDLLRTWHQAEPRLGPFGPARGSALGPAVTE